MYCLCGGCLLLFIGNLLLVGFKSSKITLLPIIWLSDCPRCWFRMITSPILTGTPVKGSEANSTDPDQTPHTVASDQGLHCMLTGFSIQNRMKAKI